MGTNGFSEFEDEARCAVHKLVLPLPGCDRRSSPSGPHKQAVGHNVAFFDNDLGSPRASRISRSPFKSARSLKSAMSLSGFSRMSIVERAALRFPVKRPRPFLHPSMLHSAEDLCLIFAPVPCIGSRSGTRNLRGLSFGFSSAG